MTILIDNKSGVPIYEQIVCQLRDQIQSGALAPDQGLPSIRNLAKDLGISVITTKRAYEELERAGLIYTVGGKGSFVAAPNWELLREERLKQIEGHIEEIWRLARVCDLDQQDILDMVLTMKEDSQ